MIADLSLSLKAMLQAQERPQSVRDAEIDFEPPVENYKPSIATINVFLYDLREDLQLRSNVADWNPLREEIRPAPFRLACSYLVTTWPGTTVSGEEAILAQQGLLGEVARVLAGMAELDGDYLQGGLVDPPYPIPLTLSHVEPTSDPARFWTALGGKLRPAITLTATISLVPAASPVKAYPVSTRTIVLNTEAAHRIGGTVRDKLSRDPLPDVALELLDLGVRASSGADGRYAFSDTGAATYQLRATRAGYVSRTLSITVPGATPTAFDVELTATP